MGVRREMGGGMWDVGGVRREMGVVAWHQASISLDCEQRGAW